MTFAEMQIFCPDLAHCAPHADLPWPAIDGCHLLTFDQAAFSRAFDFKGVRNFPGSMRAALVA